MGLILDMLNKVNDVSPDNFYGAISEILSKKKKAFVVTANPEIIMNGRNNNEVFNILYKKAIVIPDGIGVAKAVGFLKGKEVARNTGVDLVEFLLEESNRMNYKILIYGSKQNVLESLKEKCDKIYPNIEFEGMYNGYENSEQYVLKQIEKSKADIYLIALGSPRQELFINSFFEYIEYGVCVGVGGSFDVLSGHIKRAPGFFINHNLEWLYRVLTQPKRLRRFVRGNIKFVLLFVPELFKIKFCKTKME